VLHFTGLIESIGDVCAEHGLLPLTHEVGRHRLKPMLKTPGSVLENKL
jgi:hypothetical protein